VLKRNSSATGKSDVERITGQRAQTVADYIIARPDVFS
jgi:hypothetical protein